MKKILMSVFALALCVFSGVGFAACKNNLSYNKTYQFAKISMMGFSGDRKDIQSYLESSAAREDASRFVDCFDIAMQIEVTFDKNNTGKLALVNFAGIVNDGTSSTTAATQAEDGDKLNSMYQELKDAGKIDENGTVTFGFDYIKKGDKITIGTVHTGLTSVGTNGDISFVDAIDLLISEASKKPQSSSVTRIINEDANVVTIKKNKLEMKLTVSYKNSASSENPDFVTDMYVTFAK